MGMKASEIEAFIKAAFPDAEIEMRDLAARVHSRVGAAGGFHFHFGAFYFG